MITNQGKYFWSFTLQWQHIGCVPLDGTCPPLWEPLLCTDNYIAVTRVCESLESDVFSIKLLSTVRKSFTLKKCITVRDCSTGEFLIF